MRFMIIMKLLSCMIENNNTEIDGCKFYGIRIAISKSCLIQNSKISNVQLEAIRCGNNSDVTVKNCIISHVNTSAFFFFFVDGFITAENNQIDDDKKTVAKLAFNGGGILIDNKIVNCLKLNECIMPSSYFFSCNGNFPNIINDRSRIEDSILYEDSIQINNQLYLKCNKNKRENYIFKFGHKFLCNECAATMKSDDRCPLCNNSCTMVVYGKDVTDGKKCKICIENEIDCIIVPCVYLCACESYLKNWLNSNKTCPICRKEVSTYQNSEIFDCFDEKRKERENDTYICSLIRQDSIEEFITYVNPLKSEIVHSIFETNSFLLENEKTSLIEYSAFFRAIQIFRYLMHNNVELEPSLWLYAIHSQNAALIHFLESNEIAPPENKMMKNKYEAIFIESIKFHHNSIADYIKNNFLYEENKIEKNEIFFSNIMKFHRRVKRAKLSEDINQIFYIYLN